MMKTIFDTIAAISTPRGEGGVGIIRLSVKSDLTWFVEFLLLMAKKNTTA